MRRVSAPDLVGFPTQRQGDDDQVAGGALNQGRARAGPVLADDQVAFPVARDFPIRNVRALINQPHPNDGGFAPACGGFLAHPPARGQANAVFDERLLGVGVDPRVDRLVADRVALSVGRSVHGGQCATRLLTQAPADLAGSVPLRQISNHTVAKDLITIQQALLRATPGRAGCLVGFLGPVLPVRARMAGDLTAHHRGATPNQVSDTHLGQAHIHPRHDRRTILDSKHPTTPHDQPPNSITATRKLLTPYDTAECIPHLPPYEYSTTYCRNLRTPLTTTGQHTPTEPSLTTHDARIGNLVAIHYEIALSERNSDVFSTTHRSLSRIGGVR